MPGVTVPPAFSSEFTFSLALHRVIIFLALLALVRVYHCFLAIGTLATAVLCILVAASFAAGLGVVRARLICGFVVCHIVCLFVV
jgi:hypothetical protein